MTRIGGTAGFPIAFCWQMASTLENELKPALKRGYVAAYRILKNEDEFSESDKENELEDVTAALYDINRGKKLWTRVLSLQT